VNRHLQWLPFLLAVAIAVATLSVRLLRDRARQRISQEVPDDPSLVLVTGYCNCGACCGWKRSWLGFGEPVYDYGAMKGKPKKIGVTASGTKAKRGTIAADPKVFPFGTHLHVPGYGPGTVEDVGGSIRGRHVDIWFPSHAEARKWGSKWLKVQEIR